MDNNSSRIEYNWINVYIDHQNYNRVWAEVHYTEYRRTRNVSKSKIIQFKNYNEMMSFLKNNFNCYELEHPVSYLEKRIFMHNVDYLHANYLSFASSPDNNHFDLYIREYNNNGSSKDRVIQFEPRYQGMIKELLKNNRNLPQNAHLGPDLYQVVDVNAIINGNSNSVDRVSRREKRIEKEKNAMPMPKPKERHPIRNLIVFLSTVVTVFGVSKGIVLANRKADISDGISLDNMSDFGDFNLLYNKGHIGSVLEKLVRNEYHGLSENDIKETFEYLDELERSNYDHNDSLNNIVLGEYKYDVGISPEKSDLLDALDYKYNKCFHRPNANNNHYELNKEGAQKFLDFALPLILMNNGYYKQRPNTTVPRSLVSYNSNHPTTEQVNTYDELPDTVKIIISKKVRWLLSHVTDYELDYTYYLNKKDKASLLGTVMDIVQMDQGRVIDSQRIANNEATKSQGR